MNIWIHPEIFTNSNNKYLPKGFVHFCATLNGESIRLNSETDSLRKRQNAQIELEELFSDFQPADKNGLIEFDKSEGKLLFWVGETCVASGYDFADLLASYQTGKERTASIARTTNETDISIELNLDGTGKNEISTGLNFFDHMLEQIARHGFVDLNLRCDGDLQVDEHHTIEDVAIALGECITSALGDKKGIERYAFVLPMDETQATVAMDLSGRPYLVFEGEFNRVYVGDMPTEMVKHFFYSLAMHLKATLHIEFKGDNDHHKIEAIFKGFARVLKTAVEKNPRIKNMIPSSKGSL
ncbi:MAG: imidazoleglycerol-phosphate dehydratase HisB [Balneolaceae bacterium]|nr:imidazoleglycerol-phosphate dehydratase HisB [Balneolaceae bacterium]